MWNYMTNTATDMSNKTFLKFYMLITAMFLCTAYIWMSRAMKQQIKRINFVKMRFPRPDGVYRA